MNLFRVLALGALLAFSAAAQAQTGTAVVVSNCGTPPTTYTAGQTRPVTQNTSGEACADVAVSASISGFQPASVGTPIAVTTGGDTGTLPAGAVVVATNVGANGAYCALGAASTTAQQYIAPAGGWFAFTVGGATQLTCITSASTTTINMVGGAGLPTGVSGVGGGSSGGTSAVDAAAFTAGASSYTPVGGIYQTTATSNALTNGQAGVGQLTANRALHTNLRTAAGVETGVAAAPLQVSLANTGSNATAVLTTGTGGTFPATQSGTWTVQPGNTANTTPWLVTGSGTAGSAATGVLSVQGIASMTPVQVSQATASNLNAQVVGAAASGASVSGNPLLTGARAATATPTAVTNGQAVAAMADASGRLVTMPYAPKELRVSGCASATGTSATEVIAAQGSGAKIYVTTVSISNTGGSNSLMTLQTDTAGSPATIWQTISPTVGGSNISFPAAIVGADNKNVGFTAGTSSTTQYVCMAGYVGP